MKLLTNILHGVLDYIVGLFLITSPWLLNYTQNGPETWMPVIIGTVVILYSLFTNYKLGFIKNISLKNHLSLDTFTGIFLAISPWLFNFSSTIYWPHLILGLIILAVVSITKNDMKNLSQQYVNHVMNN